MSKMVDIMARKRCGLLTKSQMDILKLRHAGLTQEEIAKKFNTTRQNIALIEKRGKRNLRLAEETIREHEKITTMASVEVRSGTHMVDIPRLVVDAADEANVKLRADFTRIYNEIRFKAPECVSGTKVIRPITVLILKDGDIELIPGESNKNRRGSRG
jgi:Tfx family DNA-binding protein